MHQLLLPLLLSLLSTLADAATRTVCASGCDYATFQAAWAASACGDTISITAGEVLTAESQITTLGDCTSNPVIVTTSKPTWIPAEGVRVTPGDIANMPTLRGSGDQTLSMYRSAGGVVRGAKFIGIHFLQNGGNTNAPVWTNNWFLGSGRPTTTAHLPDAITFDRVVIGVPLDDDVPVARSIQLETRSAIVMNSFLYGSNNGSQESQGIAAIDALGPWTITNNFLVSPSMPVIVGGGRPDIQNLNPSMSYTYNFYFRPWKWINSTTNPYQSHWTAQQAFNTGVQCMKNGFELKKGDGVTWVYNVNENQWADGTNYCLSQWHAGTINVKNDTPCGYTECSGGSASAPTTSSFTWTQDLCAQGRTPCLLEVGWSVCLEFGVSMTCRQIATIDNPGKSGTITGVWPGTGSTKKWTYATDPFAKMRNIRIENNIFRRYASGFSLIGYDQTFDADSGFLDNVTLSNNLVMHDVDAGRGISMQSLKVLPTSLGVAGSMTGRNLKIEHNTFDWPILTNWIASWDQTQSPTLASAGGYQPLFNSTSISSNIFPPSNGNGFGIYWQGNGMCSGNQGGDCTNLLFATDSSIRNNTTPDVLWTSPACSGGRDCSGNFSGAYTRSFLAGFKLPGTSAYAKAGHDGADIGVDTGQLPEIRNLRVSVSSQTALLEADLSAPIRDAGATQPCTFEVSPNENLMSLVPQADDGHLGNSWTVINDLNPAHFIRPTSSTRTNAKLLPVVVADSHLSWPIGQQTTIADDNSVSRDLRLTPSTRYYGRLMCYGDTRHFQFVTAAATSGATAVSMKFNPPSGITGVTVDYGTTTALGSQVTAAVSGGTATVSVPAVAGRHLYHRITYTGGAGYVGSMKVILP